MALNGRCAQPLELKRQCRAVFWQAVCTVRVSRWERSLSRPRSDPLLSEQFHKTAIRRSAGAFRVLRRHPAPMQIKPGGCRNLISLLGVFHFRACGHYSIEIISINPQAAPKLKIYFTPVLGKVRCPLKVRR